VDQIIGAMIALVSAGLGFAGTLLVEWLRGKNELRRQAAQQRVEAYRNFLRAVQMFDMHLDMPEGDSAREGIPSEVELTANLINSNADLFLFGSDKSQQVGTYLMRACLDNAARDPRLTDLFGQWRYQFISVVREELGESVAPPGEGRLPEYWSQPLPSRSDEDQEQTESRENN
jgi:hypothetical protein